MESSSESSLSDDLKFRVYVVLVAAGVAIFLAVCFWRLYKLTVSARPEDMMPIASVKAAAELRERDISELPVFVHGGGGTAADTGGGVECAVCLAEIRDGERGRLLPGCGHRFHVECIDRWFRANSTCPLCRAAAVGETGAVEAHKGGSVSVAVPVIVVQG